ncbi:EthD domain-containing protein [Pseudonocardia dioxanivorans]|uniref:EthD domain-containing protein n=1 Tax=Pseudonocardia dioxanivorans TaxID=240495 RepID=UPI00131A5FF4|nr:EthD domain-containing protein [Pseudonocardia dioxanivorans]
MITRFGLAPRKTGCTVARFQQHWRDRHGPVIGALPGLRRYWQNHAIAGSPLPWPGFDACSEMDADDVAAFDAVFAHPHYLDAGRADERRFVDRSRGGAVLTERVSGAAPAAVTGVRVLTLLRTAPGVGPGELAAVLRLPGRGGHATAVEAFVRLPELPGVVDGVEALWFRDSAAALAHLGSDAAEADRRALAGIVVATERVLAAVHVVALDGGQARARS